MTLVAGGLDSQIVDGVGAAARFDALTSILITSDGTTLWCGERRGQLRRVALSTREVTTHTLISSDSDHHRLILGLMVWDRVAAANKNSDSAFYCQTYMSYGTRHISRIDIAARSCHSYEETSDLSLHSLVCTPSRFLIYTHGEFDDLDVFNPQTRAFESLGLVLGRSSVLQLIDSTRTLVAVSSHGIVTYTLAPRFFPVPTCCDRDL